MEVCGGKKKKKKLNPVLPGWGVDPSEQALVLCCVDGSARLLNPHPRPEPTSLATANQSPASGALFINLTLP